MDVVSLFFDLTAQTKQQFSAFKYFSFFITWPKVQTPVIQKHPKDVNTEGWHVKREQATDSLTLRSFAEESLP